MIFFNYINDGTSFDMSRFAVIRKLTVVIHLNNKEMKTDKYESPALKILEISAEQAIMVASFTGEGINEWEEM